MNKLNTQQIITTSLNPLVKIHQSTSGFVDEVLKEDITAVGKSVVIIAVNHKIAKIVEYNNIADEDTPPSTYKVAVLLRALPGVITPNHQVNNIPYPSTKHEFLDWDHQSVSFATGWGIGVRNALNESIMPQCFKHTLSVGEGDDSHWYINNSVSDHMKYDLSNLLNHVPFRKSTRVIIGNGLSSPITHVGTLLLHTPSRNLFLNPVYYVPKLSHNLLYVNQLCRTNSCSIDFDGNSDHGDTSLHN